MRNDDFMTKIKCEVAMYFESGVVPKCIFFLSLFCGRAQRHLSIRQSHMYIRSCGTAATKELQKKSL